MWPARESTNPMGAGLVSTNIKSTSGVQRVVDVERFGEPAVDPVRVHLGHGSGSEVGDRADESDASEREQGQAQQLDA